MKRHEYRDRIIKTLNFEQQIYKEFEQLCQEENVYPSQKLQELMLETLQKKVVGQNPLNVPYGKLQEKPSDIIKTIPPLETLDVFIETGKFTVNEWDVIVKEINDSEQCERYQNLAACIQSSFKKQNHFLRTGKRLVTSGHIEHVPSEINR